MPKLGDAPVQIVIPHQQRNCKEGKHMQVIRQLKPDETVTGMDSKLHMPDF
jgi:hypothetical protein